MKVKTLEKLAQMGVAPEESNLDATQTYESIKQSNREFPGEVRDSINTARKYISEGASKLTDAVTSRAYWVDTLSQMATATGIMSYFEHNLGLTERLLTRGTYAAIGLFTNRGLAVAADKAKSLCGATEEGSGFRKALYMGALLAATTAVYAGITATATAIAGGEASDVIKNLMETAGPAALLTWIQLECVVPLARKLCGTTPKTETPTLEEMEPAAEPQVQIQATDAYAVTEVV